MGRPSTGGHCTRVATVTLENMEEDAVAILASLRQFLNVSVCYCSPAFVSWLSILRKLTRVPLFTNERRTSLILTTAAKLGTVIIFLDTKSHLTFFSYLDMSVWSQLYDRLVWETPFDSNCFEFFVSTGNIFSHAGIYQLFCETFRLFRHSFTRISKIVLGLKMCFNSNTVECHFDLLLGYYIICVKYTVKHCAR